jgi:hypothetical protein
VARIGDFVAMQMIDTRALQTIAGDLAAKLKKVFDSAG